MKPTLGLTIVKVRKRLDNFKAKQTDKKDVLNSIGVGSKEDEQLMD